MKKVNENYYRIYTDPICTAFLDEYLMKKANKILYKYINEIESLLVNNKDHLIKHTWSLCYPKGKQTTFHSYEQIDKYTVLVPRFRTEKAENLYDLDGKCVHNEDVANTIAKLMEGGM